MATLLLVSCDAGVAAVPPGAGADEPPHEGVPPALASPDVTGARWATDASPHRIVYGKEGEAPLIALECVQNGPQPQLLLTRLAPAPAGGKAIFAVDGNGYIGRWHADAAEVNGERVWQSTIDLSEYKLPALTGPRFIEATVSGAGTVVIHQNELPRQLVETCRGFTVPSATGPTQPPGRSASPG